MKPIILKVEHEKMLMEMVTKLYPEYPVIRLEKDHLYFYTKENIERSADEDHPVEEANDWLYLEDTDIVFHWFEFISTQLNEKLQNHELDIFPPDIVWLTVYENKHPVDVVYETFKKT